MMINQGEVAKMLAYEAKDHGYYPMMMYIKNPDYIHTVVSDDPFNGALSMEIPYTLSHGISTVGNSQLADNSKFIIPLKMREMSMMFKITANARIEIPITGSANFRELAIYLVNLDTNNSTMLDRMYFTPSVPNQQPSLVPIRANLPLLYSGFLELEYGTNYGIGLGGFFRTDDKVVEANLTVEMYPSVY